MLVLTRKHNETLHIGNDVVITIVRVRGDAVRIGIQAPKEVAIMRSELMAIPAKQTDNPQDKHAKPAKRAKSSDTENGNRTTEQGPLAAFLKVLPKVELAIAS
ncbi:MAG: carbon storage regulator [Pirellulaceae bacterium]|nr:carbon storage regulator [Pirellulaceae bacterium]